MEKFVQLQLPLSPPEGSVELPVEVEEEILHLVGSLLVEVLTVELEEVKDEHRS